MPLYYTSIAEEYRAVRETVGLFDVTHMGIIEIEGENACDFVDAVSTNYARWIHPGQSQYSFLLNPEGEVIDDIIIYCQSNRKYMIICNANNQGKVFYWLQAVHSKKYLIDEEYPVRKIKTLVSIRNLKDPSEGKKQKIDITLQGPNSFCVLEKLAKDEVLQSKIRSLEKNTFIKEKLAGKDIIISHTGYAGEKMGFELYLHPKDGPFIWSLIIKEGQKLGLKPCGLGARDATRVEAGLPLHGHELAGKYKIDPVAAGYGHFVKFHKPFFVGRKILLEKEKKRQKGKKIIRFKLKSSFSRMIRREDPVVDKKGKDVGIVTSCVLAGDSQIGLAYIDARIEEGEKITIFPVLHGKIKEKPAQNLSENSKKILSQEAIVLPRFPEEK